MRTAPLGPPRTLTFKLTLAAKIDDGGGYHAQTCSPADRRDAGQRRPGQSSRQPAAAVALCGLAARATRPVGLAGRLGATRSLDAEGPTPTLGLSLVSCR